MDERRTVCVVVTARPSYARVRTVLEALKARRDVTLQVVAAASALAERYGKVADVMAAEGFAPDAVVASLVEDHGVLNMPETTAQGLSGTAAVFADLAPDLVVTVADRYETLATAVAAAYMNIPLAHLQGGEVTGNIDEKVRHAVTKLADMHLVSGPGAAARVARMGERPEAIHETGCPSLDVARQAIEAGKRLPDDALYARFGQSGGRPDLSDGYIVVMQHPVTTSHDAAHAQITETLDAVRNLDQSVLWFAPNVDIGADATARAIQEYRAAHRLDHVHFMDNMPPEDFIRLLADSHGIVGNSSVAIRECAWLGIGAVNIGDRQSGRDRGPNVVDVGYDAAAIRAAITAMGQDRMAPSELYGDGWAGPRIAAILATAPLRFEKRLTY
ncbi:MAG: UDP-N-acetylglucosamine 2-epimerase [Pseudomonadota bacterium]